MKEEFTIQFAGREKTEEDLMNEAHKAWTSAGNKADELKSCSLYIQPETEKVYYVMNDEFKGDFAL
ncbi:hypothetical protein SAMN06296386_110113 [Lachnospiraceae bacterium]|nr:hypothetical protein SAMN06296386_110113 [Lachnospiraceae bacterium]